MADLSVKVKLNTQSAINSLTKLQNKINSVNNKLNGSNAQEQKLATTIQKATAKQDKFTKSTQKAVTAQKQVHTHAHGLLGTLTKVASVYASIKTLAMAAGAAIGAADTFTNSRNKLNYVHAQGNGDSGENGYSQATLDATETSLNKIYASAQRVRVGFSDMAANVGKSMALAGEAFGGNIDNAIRFQEVMSKAYAIGGASATEVSSSMYQMVQALGSGVLQGEELRSLMEGAPLAAKKIEEFAQKVYGTTDSLKKLASEGKITSDIVVAAVLDMGDAMDTAFNNTRTTFAQAGQMLGNAFLWAFKPVVTQLTDFLNSEVGAKVMNGLLWIINALGQAATFIMNIVISVATFIVNNWSWLQYVFYTVLTALVVWLMYTAVTSVIAAWTSIKAWFAATLPFLAIAAVIVLVIGVIIHLAQTAGSGAQFIAEAAYTVGLIIITVATMVAIITGNLVLMWVMIAIGAILLIVAAVSAYGETIGGYVGLVVAFIANLFIGLVNSILNGLYWLISPILSVVEWFANVFGGGFDSIGNACFNLLGQIVSGFLALAKVVTPIIDAIFGTNWTGKLTSLQEKALSWGKNNNAITISREAPQIEYLDYGDAWNTGRSIGASAQNGINDFGTSAQNWINDKLSFEGTGLDSFNAENGALSFDPGAGTALDTTKIDAPPVPGTKKGGGGGGSKKIDDIADDTKKISDSMDMTEEDLEFLRKLANLEWKKEFTTASVTVDMKNYNTVNGDDDLDGIATKLADKLYEELNAVANGVYA